MNRSLTRQRTLRRDAATGFLFVAPQMLGFIVFVLIPLIMVFVYSVQNRKLSSKVYEFIGLDNYQKMFKTKMFWMSLKNTLIFSLLLVPMNLVLALSMALYLGGEGFGSKYVRAIIFLPVVTSGVAWALVGKYLLQPGDAGPINYALSLIGIQGPNWLHEEGWAMIAVVINRVIKNLGSNALIFTGAVLNMPSELVEAAKIDGAGRWKLLWHLQLPLRRPTILLVSMVTVIGSMRVFDTIQLMTEGGPKGSTMVLVYYIYNQAFNSFKTSYASALAVVLFVIVLVLTIIQWTMRRRLSHYEN